MVSYISTSTRNSRDLGISGGLGGVVPGCSRCCVTSDAGTRRWTSKAAWLQLKFQNEPENHEVAAKRKAVIEAVLA